MTREAEAVKQPLDKRAQGSASQKPDRPPINTDEHRLKEIGLSVFIGVYRWPKMSFSGSSIGGSCPAGFFHTFPVTGVPRRAADWLTAAGVVAGLGRRAVAGAVAGPRWRAVARRGFRSRAAWVPCAPAMALGVWADWIGGGLRCVSIGGF
jgi:hypothetical protein